MPKLKKKNLATKNITTRSSCSSQIKPSNQEHKSSIQKLKPRSQQHKWKKKKTETKHKHRPRSQIEIKHKWNPDHNPSQNHQRTQPPIHVHNTHMQASKFFLFPLFSRHQDSTASMIKTLKISLLICSPLVNIGWGRKRCENHWSWLHNHWSRLQYRIGDWVFFQTHRF